MEISVEKDDAKFKTITLKVSPEFHKKIKLYATDKGLTIKDYLVNIAEKDMANTEEN